MTNTDWATTVRGPLPERRMNARSTAALLDNPGCARRAVLDTARVNTERMAATLGQPVPFGQSPFALGQGNRFEQRVKANDYAELVRVLSELGIELPSALEEGNGKGFDNEARVAKTRDLLRAIAAGEPGAPNVIDHGMTKLLVGDQPVYLEQDAMAFRHGGKLHICEVKGFPLVDGTAQPDKVGAAARQSAVYLVSIQDTLEELGLDPTIVSPEVVLICPKNYTTYPTARIIDVTRELRALKRQLARRTEIDQLIADLDLSALPGPPNSDGGETESGADAAALVTHAEALVAALPYRYQPACIGSCDMARVCRSQALAADAPCTLGDEAANLLADTPTLTLARYLADTDTDEPAQGAEAENADNADNADNTDNADVAQALRRARRAQLALAPPAAPETTQASAEDAWPL